MSLPGYVFTGCCQLSTVKCQLSTVDCRLSTVNCQLSTVNCQLSTVNGHLSTVNCQLSSCSCTYKSWRFCVMACPGLPASLTKADIMHRLVRVEHIIDQASKVVGICRYRLMYAAMTQTDEEKLKSRLGWLSWIEAGNPGHAIYTDCIEKRSPTVSSIQYIPGLP